jgi:serine/threonine protein kinase
MPNSNDNNTDDKTVTHVLLTTGVEVSHYRILERVGVGGMGEVYLADDTKLNRRVALKFLPTNMSQDPDTRRRFVREAQAAAGLDHPNIVTVYEVSEFSGRPFFSMQYIKGKTLQHYCQERLPVEEVIDLVEVVANGLSQAHDKGITHRDIKPANIIVDTEMHPKILDFGLAAVRGGEELTQAGSTLGTIAYMSPEQAQGHTVDHRSDLFSLGVVFYELLTGVAPFRKDNTAATLNMILNTEPEPINGHKTDIPDSIQSSLQAVITKCFAKDPNSRYQTAKELSTSLRAIKDSLASPDSMSNIEQAEVRPSIAVLPFANMSADPENEYFSDGLTEELLNVLAKNPELKVTGRTSSFAFKGVQEDLREIGKKLGVRTLLEGSVRRSGARVRITAQLVNVSDGFHLWSETYDRTLEDIFAVQDEIAAEVSRALDVTLLGKSSHKHTTDQESHALVMRGNFFSRRMTKESTDTAIDFYQRALKLDANNAQALAGLANTYGAQAAFGFHDTREAYLMAKENALQALEIDGRIPGALIALGWIRTAFEYDYDGGVALYRKAVELAPNDSQAVGGLGKALGLLGNFDEGLRLVERAAGLDPLDPEAHMWHGLLLLTADKLEESRDAMYQALKLSPSMTSTYSMIGITYLLEDRFEEALSVVTSEEAAGFRNCTLAMIYHAQGRTDESDKALHVLLECGPPWGIQIAMVHAFRNECDEAFEWLEKSATLNDAGIPLVKTFPAFNNLHKDPRWPELLKSIGFTKP